MRTRGRHTGRSVRGQRRLRPRPSIVDGTRTRVPALGSTTITGVAPGAAIPSPTYQPAEDAERFIAVYTGTLGNEVPVPNQDPNLNFPGGVIGKVRGGVRAEELFNDS